MNEEISKLCIHSITLKPWTIEELADNFLDKGVKGITLWRRDLERRKPEQVGERLRKDGFDIVSLCRGGFFPSVSAGKRLENIEENIKAIGEAAAVGAPLLVLVCGADPGQSLAESRKQIEKGIEAVLPKAEELNVKLAIEPLHPMYADSRSAINTLAQANDIAESINSPFVGVAVDVYHLWWEPGLNREILRCGKNGHLFAFHISDWKYPVEDILNDRGLMGEGCIDIPGITQQVEAAGFHGYSEVEIFSNRYWKKDQHQFLDEIISAYKKHA